MLQQETSLTYAMQLQLPNVGQGIKCTKLGCAVKLKLALDLVLVPSACKEPTNFCRTDFHLTLTHIDWIQHMPFFLLCT